MVIQPVFALFWGILFLSLVLLVFWPQKGLFARITNNRLNARRILLEDALKYLFDCEYKGLSCRLNALAGNLHISADRTARLLESLRHIGLIIMDRDTIKLTELGRSYALRIIRVHRIWERYLADETGTHHLDWHGQADLKEHEITLAAADLLAAQIGNPVFDPHGDPIPSSAGELPDYSGKPMSEMQEGELARIVHIEDEPQAIYSQIVALGLYPGMQVYMMDVSQERLQFAANGEECILSPLLAVNITVEAIVDREPPREKYAPLSSLKAGERAQIKGIAPACRGQQRRRLMDLGIVPGAVVEYAFPSPGNDPIAYLVMGALVAIRKSQSDFIFIEPLNQQVE
jgi:DtxR family Mn-dependent transcriptional regulator